ncbi:Aste57867_9492 [Aphanomyces stellatus]|uniref:Aste57867_9492 protein n=1 Tax=Aphanomyces stellatus TaxID=120398 RepID=A0A485KN08_9STRA|nr:hypothetical protein As57867_009455 [Aphanomyces stellatus]VFT86371.1 Aste57867_9492 [Aphanomyces stellatus]
MQVCILWVCPRKWHIRGLWVHCSGDFVGWECVAWDTPGKLGKTAHTSVHIATGTLVAYVQRLDLVAAMARHLIFVSLICSNYAYWSHPTVLEAAVVRYRQFCHLADDGMTKSAKTWMPTIDIALVRYVHQTKAQTPLSFFSLPSVAKDGDMAAAAAYAETFLLWAETFRGPYSSFAPSYDAFKASKESKHVLKLPFRAKKWDKYHWIPSRNSRFIGVDESAAVPMAVAVAATPQQSSAPPTAAEYIAVIGTPLMDNRVQPPRAATVLRGPRGVGTMIDTTDPFYFYVGFEVSASAIMVIATTILSVLG